MNADDASELPVNQISSGWNSFEGGASIGKRGSEHGVIGLDDEHAYGARITLERDATPAPFSITCGPCGGLFVHTRFFGAEDSAKEAFQSMKTELARILRLIPDEANSDRDEGAVMPAMHNFVGRFPERSPAVLD
jgi:hypothetical protein